MLKPKESTQISDEDEEKPGKILKNDIKIMYISPESLMQQSILSELQTFKNQYVCH